jgi:hypothetical protein
MPGMPWSQQAKLKSAGDALATSFEPAAQSAGMHIAQMNIRIDPPAGQEGDPSTMAIFEWDEPSGEYLMRISG